MKIVTLLIANLHYRFTTTKCRNSYKAKFKKFDDLLHRLTFSCFWIWKSFKKYKL